MFNSDTKSGLEARGNIAHSGVGGVGDYNFSLFLATASVALHSASHPFCCAQADWARRMSTIKDGRSIFARPLFRVVSAKHIHPFDEAFKIESPAIQAFFPPASSTR